MDQSALYSVTATVLPVLLVILAVGKQSMFQDVYKEYQVVGWILTMLAAVLFIVGEIDSIAMLEQAHTSQLERQIAALSTVFLSANLAGLVVLQVKDEWRQMRRTRSHKNRPNLSA
jgi:hypothetical protein